MSLAKEWYNAGKDLEVLDKQKYLGAECHSYYQVMTYYYAFPDNSLAVIDVDENGDTYLDYRDNSCSLDYDQVELNPNIESFV